MSQSVDALWKSVVQQLQQLPAQGPEQQWGAFSTIYRQIEALTKKESLPQATMKHLIMELKVRESMMSHDTAWRTVSWE